jgi:hypothetical protein
MSYRHQQQQQCQKYLKKHCVLCIVVCFMYSGTEEQAVKPTTLNQAISKHSMINQCCFNSTA